MKPRSIDSKAFLIGLGAEVRRRRKALDLSQAKLAYLAHVHANVVGRLERGVYNPQPHCTARARRRIGHVDSSFDGPGGNYAAHQARQAQNRIASPASIAFSYSVTHSSPAAVMRCTLAHDGQVSPSKTGQKHGPHCISVRQPAGRSLSDSLISCGIVSPPI